MSPYVTNWTGLEDAQLLRLMCYINSTLHYRQEGVVGYSIASLECAAYGDVGVAVCFETQISTTGGQVCIEGPNTHFPLQALSQIQDSIATSTPEATIISASPVTRTIVIPDMDLCDNALKRAGVQGALR